MSVDEQSFLTIERTWETEDLIEKIDTRQWLAKPKRTQDDDHVLYEFNAPWYDDESGDTWPLAKLLYDYQESGWMLERFYSLVTYIDGVRDDHFCKGSLRLDDDEEVAN